MPEEPMSQADAKRLAQEILATGTTTFSRHAREEMAKDNLQATDVLNVLRAGVNEPAEFENGSWRHRFRTARMAVIVVFRSDTELRVVTAWRFKP